MRSSKNIHQIETRDYKLFWGLNENQRLSTKFFTDKPKLSIPDSIANNISCCFSHSKVGGHTYPSHLLNFDDWTWEITMDPWKGREWVCLCGNPSNFKILTSVKTDGGFWIPPRDASPPFPRSLFQKSTIYTPNQNNSRIIFFPGIYPNMKEEQDCEGESSCKILKVADYNDFQLFLEKNMKIVANRFSSKELTGLNNGVSTIPAEIIGISSKTQDYTISAEWAIFKEMVLDFHTQQGNFQKFRNIFNGPYSTISITFDKRLVAWGRNPNNLLGLSGLEANQTIVFPPKIIDSFPNADDIKQISIGYTHTLVLLHNSTVFGVGSNSNGELGRNDSDSFSSFTQIQFPDEEEACLKAKTCSIELVAAEFEVSFIVFNYGTEKHVEIKPICYGKSYIDLDSCSMNGVCIGEDKCECFDEYSGPNCNVTLACPNNCYGNGYCNSSGICTCYSHATGNDCSIAVC